MKNKQIIKIKIKTNFISIEVKNILKHFNKNLILILKIKLKKLK